MRKGLPHSLKAASARRRPHHCTCTALHLHERASRSGLHHCKQGHCTALAGSTLHSSRVLQQPPLARPHDDQHILDDDLKNIHSHKPCSQIEAFVRWVKSSRVHTPHRSRALPQRYLRAGTEEPLRASRATRASHERSRHARTLARRVRGGVPGARASPALSTRATSDMYAR